MSSPDAATPVSALTRRPQALSIASTLCWCSGILVVLVSVAMLIPALAASGVGALVLLFAVGAVLVAGTYMYAGYALRKQQKAGGWAAALVSVIMAAQVAVGGRLITVGLALNLAILGLVIGSWRHLRAR